MTVVGINNAGLIKLEDNAPFTQDSFGPGSARLSNLSEALLSPTLVLDSLVLDSDTILSSCSSKCLLIPKNLQKSAFVTCFSTMTFTREFRPSSRALRCVFVGYSSTQKGYKCFHPPSKKFFVSRDVTFHEEEPYFTQPYLQGENFKEDKLENLDLSGLESNTLNLSSIKSNTFDHSSHESNTPNLSDLESNPPNSSSLESNRPNLFGPELNTLVPDPSEAEDLGVESNKSTCRYSH